jgi:hypothetical protein
MGALFGQSNVPVWAGRCDRLRRVSCAGRGVRRHCIKHAISDVFVSLDVEVFVVFDGKDELDVVAGAEVERGIAGEEAFVGIGGVRATDELRNEKVGNRRIWAPHGSVIKIQLVFENGAEGGVNIAEAVRAGERNMLDINEEGIGVVGEIVHADQGGVGLLGIGAERIGAVERDLAEERDGLREERIQMLRWSIGDVEADRRQEWIEELIVAVSVAADTVEEIAFGIVNDGVDGAEGRIHSGSGDFDGGFTADGVVAGHDGGAAAFGECGSVIIERLIDARLDFNDEVDRWRPEERDVAGFAGELRGSARGSDEADAEGGIIAANGSVIGVCNGGEREQEEGSEKEAGNHTTTFQYKASTTCIGCREWLVNVAGRI